jgi:hypothetical protein
LDGLTAEAARIDNGDEPAHSPIPAVRASVASQIVAEAIPALIAAGVLVPITPCGPSFGTPVATHEEDAERRLQAAIKCVPFSVSGFPSDHKRLPVVVKFFCGGGRRASPCTNGVAMVIRTTEGYLLAGTVEDESSFHVRRMVEREIGKRRTYRRPRPIRALWCGDSWYGDVGAFCWRHGLRGLDTRQAAEGLIAAIEPPRRARPPRIFLQDPKRSAESA